MYEMRRMGSRVDHNLPLRQQYPEAVGIHPPDSLLLVARDEVISESERQATVNRLLSNPYELTYQCSLVLEFLEEIYPGLSNGAYLPEAIPVPSESTQRTLKYFGVIDDETFINRTKNVIRQVFSSNPESGETVNRTLDYVNTMHGNQSRRTGESRISHEARILLRSLADAFIYHDILEKATTVTFEGKHFELPEQVYVGGHHLDFLAPP